MSAPSEDAATSFAHDLASPGVPRPRHTDEQGAGVTLCAAHGRPIASINVRLVGGHRGTLNSCSCCGDWWAIDGVRADRTSVYALIPPSDDPRALPNARRRRATAARSGAS